MLFHPLLTEVGGVLDEEPDPLEPEPELKVLPEVELPLELPLLKQFP